jgi:uncharacterized protein YaaW (UPF0174 family)
MSYVFVGQGGVTQIANLQQYENSIPEGSAFQVRLSLRTAVTQAVVTEIKSQMISHGVTEGNAAASGNTLTLSARKGFPWLAVIAGIILAIAVLLIIIISWSIFRQVIPEELQGIAGIGIIVIALIVALSLSSNKRGKHDK